MLTAGFKGYKKNIFHDALRMEAPGADCGRSFRFFVHIQGKHRGKQLSEETAA